MDNHISKKELTYLMKLKTELDAAQSARDSFLAFLAYRYDLEDGDTILGSGEIILHLKDEE